MSVAKRVADEVPCKLSLSLYTYIHVYIHI